MSPIKIMLVPAKGKGVFACKTFYRGEVILAITGTIVPLGDAGPLSLQIGANEAIESPEGAIDNYLNHSCDPNAVIRILPDRRVLLYAAMMIRAGEEITFDYETTESDMISQGCSFDCKCGSENCRSEIVGFSRAHWRAREEIILDAAPHLLAEMS